MNEQAENMRRVSDAIRVHVRAFIDARLARYPCTDFVMSELSAYVAEKCGGFVAPDSAGRILRHMRRTGLVDVELVDRARSLYRVHAQ